MSLKSTFLYILVLTCIVFPVFATDHLVETRYCGTPKRDAQGEIVRNSYVVKVFKEKYPLPKAYKPKDWYVDHVIPLAKGGCDAVRNLQWLHRSVKNQGMGLLYCKDCTEMDLYPVGYATFGP